MACSAVNNGNGLTIPIATNTVAVLPPYLGMPWLSIERVCVSLHSLADLTTTTGEKLLVRCRDYAHWLKMFGMTKSEHWKSFVFFRDNL